MTKQEKKALIFVMSELKQDKDYQESCYPEVFRFKDDPDWPFNKEFSLEQYQAFRIGFYMGLSEALEYLSTYFCGHGTDSL